MTRTTDALHQLGQSLWLDNITRDLLDNGTLQRYIDDLSVTGLTSNPSIFDKAVRNASYDPAIATKVEEGKTGEDLFFELAIEDLTRASDLFRPVHDRTNGVDGWVSLEVSPTLAYDTKSTLTAAKKLHAQADRPNLFIKIPGTREGRPAIEEAIFAGVPVNVTLLFSREDYLGAAEAYLRGIERRLEAGLNPRVGSVASLFISRWDAAVKNELPEELHNRLGIAVAQQAYRAYRDLLDSDRWHRLANSGAMPQRILWASTGTKDPAASDYLYVAAMAAPHTINTMPEKTLLAFAENGALNGIVPAGGGDADEVIFRIERSGVDVQALGRQLQKDGAAAFVKSWQDMMGVLHAKAQAGKQAGQSRS